MAASRQTVDNPAWRERTVQHEVAQESLKATPAIAGAVTMSLTADQWTTIVVGLVTGVYVIAQLAYLIWKWRREARQKEPTQ